MCVNIFTNSTSDIFSNLITNTYSLQLGYIPQVLFVWYSPIACNRVRDLLGFINGVTYRLD